MNKVIVHGRLTRDPEMRDAGQSRVCKFTVAENQRFNREKSNFHDCEAWNKTGEFVEKYFSKGSEIVVSGELQQREYEAKDGSSRRAWSINVDQVDFCGKASDGQGRKEQAPAAATDANGFTDIEDDELPF
jgi:single-strand DNA-binding protein